MPRRSASRRIDRPSAPSSSSSSRAAATISRARGLRTSGALEAIARAETVTDCAVDADVESPRERADEEANRHDAERREHAECKRRPEAVEEVVQRHGARMELPLLEAAA